MRQGILLLVSVLSVAAQDVPIFSWSPTGRLAEPRYSACVAALQDGRGLVAGGEGAAGTLSSVEIYGLDGQFTPGPPMNFARSQHTCTPLNDGRVLVMGGGAPAEIYDPGSNAWTALDTPGLGRRSSTATLRPDGSVVIVGGSIDDQVNAAVEIFDPATNLISTLDATLASPRQNHAAALLPDGSVLIAGGTNGSDVLATTEIIGPDGSIAAGPSLPEPRAYLSATPLPDGRVLIAGGNDGQADFSTAYLFNPSDSSLQYTSSVLNTARSRHVALAIPGNGSILIAGGDSFGTPTASSEIFDLSTETFQRAGDLTIARREIAAAVLSQPGVVLSVGGLDDSGPLNACGTFIAPAISFDKSGYVSGDTFRITGAHWKPGAVRAQVVLVNLYNVTTATYTGDVTADTTGSFQFTAPTPLTSASVGSNMHATFTAADGTSAVAGNLQKDLTTTTVSLSTTTTTAGQPVTITANVREPLALVSAIPGAVAFSVDGAQICLCSSQSFDAAANHLFTFTTSGIKGGSHVIQAVYMSNGAQMFPNSSGSAQLQVNKMGSTLTLTATHSVVVGDTIQVTITVKPVTTVSLPAPTGTVQLLVNGVTQNLALTPNNAALVSTAQFSFRALAVQTINYQASYLGDDNYNSVGPFFNSSIVSRAPVTITMTPEKSSYSLGDEIVFKVKIQTPSPGLSPTGTIQALQSIVQTSFPISFADSTGTSTTPVDFGLLGVGSWTLFVHYSGDSSFEPADAQASFEISKATPPLVMKVQNVTTLNTTFYQAGIKISDPHYMFQSRYPTGTIKVFYNGSSTAAHTFALSESTPRILDFVYTGQDSIFALIGTTFPIKFVYSGDSNYNSVQATCNAKVDLLADGSHLSCNTYP